MITSTKTKFTHWVWALCFFLFVEKVPAWGQTRSVSNDSLDYKIGQMIMMGFEGNQLNASSLILQDIKQGKVGGIIIFEKNINPTDSYKNLQKLISDLQSASSTLLFTSIDQEGGLVNRLKTKYSFPETRSATYLGNLNNLDSTKFYADNTAYILSRLGFNVNFAPVVDITVKTNPVLGALDRTYAADPEIITRHALQVIRSHQYFGVHPVLKHFPGHGSSRTDSHLGVTDVSKYWRPLELIPYKNILGSGLCDAVMTAHIVNEQLDKSKLPATLSPKVINEQLRRNLQFDGVVFSDDMQMHAISKQYELAQSIKLAIQAGVDVLVFSNNIKGTDNRITEEIHGTIKQLVNSGQISTERIDQSYQRIIRLKAKKYF
jgi:beta-N-acetylhexosaminidase